jgi:hypothetical protein
MSVTTKQKQAFIAGAQPSSLMNTITLGTVVDTNDPLEDGRIKVICPNWGETINTPIDDLPWAKRVALFGGQSFVGTRGPGIQTTKGGVAYGLWAVPKVGATAVVACLDNDPHSRVYLGTVDDIGSTHTMPHGRWIYDSHPITDSISQAKPVGPLSSSEQLIQPLADNLKRAFNFTGQSNYEWRTRAADYSVTAVDVSMLSYTFSNVADDKNVTVDGWTSKQGYQQSRIDPTAQTTLTDKNYDSMVVALTSAGFHAISLDDRQENCRIRLRTTAGHQIILDDTNERIYIATAQGNNWIELDQAGNIDLYASGNYSVHAAGDINMTSDQTIRMSGAQGVHIDSGADIRAQAIGDINVKTTANIRAHAAQSVFARADIDVNIAAGQNGYLTTGSTVNLSAGSNANITSSAELNLLASGSIIATGAEIDLNGPSTAAAAGQAAAPNEQPAFVPSRAPQHEPWARTMTASDYTTEPELAYDDPNVGRQERGKVIVRGTFWRR